MEIQDFMIIPTELVKELNDLLKTYIKFNSPLDKVRKEQIHAEIKKLLIQHIMN